MLCDRSKKAIVQLRARRWTVDELGIIGFIGAPFTLASYIIEGQGSRNYLEVKKLMYIDTSGWKLLMDKLVQSHLQSTFGACFKIRISPD
jgi:uroporphyrinogen-III decarboxylase